MESPSCTWADWSPAAAQAGSWAAQKAVLQERPCSSGRQQAECGPAVCSCGERRQLHTESCRQNCRQQAERRGLLLLAICETVSGVACSVLSSPVQGRHCCTGAGWLPVHQKNEGARTQDVSRKLVAKPEKWFLQPKRESLWEIVLLSSII